MAGCVIQCLSIQYKGIQVSPASTLPPLNVRPFLAFSTRPHFLSALHLDLDFRGLRNQSDRFYPPRFT
jgi:hypothetical protein